PARIAADVTEWTARTTTALGLVTAQTWLLGATPMPGADGTLPAAVVAERNDPGARPPNHDADNTHLRLLVERGLVGWLAVMWLTLGTMRRLRHVARRLGSDSLAPVAYAIIASLAGFLVSMNGMNTFESFPIQVFFWSLVGIGVGLTVHMNRRRRNLIWRFGDAGD
ncbi:MAG TPA: hypothetical protein VNN07_10655, partial [Candidatus Tectomicrobia bacterium]|nr:hypothetical protein [Candidatus Tectomicrobia bacterium]